VGGEAWQETGFVHQRRLYEAMLADHFKAHCQMALMVMELPFEDADCFREQQPIVVPARTFLSQLL
jgi:hypothetical protein